MISVMQFQYRRAGAASPEDGAHNDEEIKFEGGKFFPPPSVGDTVSYKSAGGRVARKVISRHFSYSSEDICSVNIVVSDVSDDEMRGRLKE